MKNFMPLVVEKYEFENPDFFENFSAVLVCHESEAKS